MTPNSKCKFANCTPATTSKISVITAKKGNRVFIMLPLFVFGLSLLFSGSSLRYFAQQICLLKESVGHIFGFICFQLINLFAAFDKTVEGTEGNGVNPGFQFYQFLAYRHLQNGLAEDISYYAL